jgi:hypothetical protein
VKVRIRFGAAVIVLLLTGCASPLSRVESFVARQSWQSVRMAGQGFQHRVFRNDVAGSSVLHVYIEGDGTPYQNRFVVAPDPTPRNPLMLHLMSLDPSRSVYIGRPCYFDTVHDAGCVADHWTSSRFSEQVVASMAQVIESELARSGASCVALFAHSGGAALAVLLAPRLTCVSRLVTIAGNLDSDAWTNFHGYSPLSRSLNPQKSNLEGKGISILHLAGSDDRIVPPALITTAATAIGGQVRLFAGFSHQCCWEAIWPEILAEEN